MHYEYPKNVHVHSFTYIALSDLKVLLFLFGLLVTCFKASAFALGSVPFYFH